MLHLPDFDGVERPLGRREGGRHRSVLGLVITLTMLPEIKGKSLEELSAEDEPKLATAAAAPG
jgi:hypothetical protein